MRFVDPIYLVLLAPAAALLTWSWSHLRGLGRGRKVAAFILRGLLMTLVILALAKPQITRRNEGTAVVYVLDRSDSVRPEDRTRAEQFVVDGLKNLGPNDIGAVIVFGGRPSVESLPAGRRIPGPISANVKAEATDVAAAIRLATGIFPEGKGRRIVLLSDGNETSGDAQRATEVAASQNIQMDVVTLGTKQGTDEALVVSLDSPSERQADEPFQIRAQIESTKEQQAILSLDRNGEVIERTSVKLTPGRSTFVFDQRLTDTGFYRYRVTLEPAADTDHRNNIGTSFTSLRQRARVLVLQSDTQKSELVEALRSAGIEAELGGPDRVPNRSEDLQGYDALLLNDLNAKTLVPGQMELMRAAVRDTGIGFAMVGGENSFLPGGWYGSAIAEALPVDLDVRQRKTFPSTSVLIVMDASGSMGMEEDGMTKLQLAAKAAEQTVKMLSSLDRVGVAGSSDSIEFVAPITELKDKNQVISNIKKVDVGGGGIYVEPSMDFAEKELTKQNTKVRHFILLADGNDADTHGISVQIARRMFQNKITTSVVAIGDGKDVTFLKQVAQAGGGNYYLVTQANKLPAIFTQDVAMMSRSAIEELVFVPKITAGEDALKGLEAASMPALLAYCLTDSKPLAKTTMKSTKDDPILSSWQYGLGTSYAFMSDAQSKWARRWVSWPGFAQFWSQMVRAMVRRQTTNEYDIKTNMENGQGRVRIKATTPTGQPMELTGDKVIVSSPTGERVDLDLVPVAPGEYEGKFGADQLGSYMVSVAEAGGDGTSRVATSGFSVPYPPEYRSFQANVPLLTRIAETGHGRMLESATDSVRAMPEPGASIQDLWLWLIGIAAILLPIDIATRRLTLPVKEIMTWWNRRRGSDAPSTSVDRIERLQKAKERVTAPEPKERIAAQKGPPPSERTSAPPRTPVPTGQSAANKLLESRRKRDDDQKK